MLNNAKSSVNEGWAVTNPAALEAAAYIKTETQI